MINIYYLSPVLPKPPRSILLKNSTSSNSISGITSITLNWPILSPLNERAMIPLGFALELPKGWEGHLAPRSSTFKTWGVIQTNSVGVVDDTYIGDNDQWHMPVYCLEAKNENGSWIKSGDKIGQFRIMEVMPEIEFEEVEVFGNDDRGGFGTTGVN